MGTDPATTHTRVLVAERDGVVAGYAETDRFRPKPGYDLYGVLIPDLVADPRFHRAYALVVLPNPGSVALHERHGFTHRGTLAEVGYKLGRYHDVAYYQREL